MKKSGRKTTPPFTRFASFISVDPINGCWNWEGATDGGGYGVFRPYGTRGTSQRKAHHFALMVWRPREASTLEPFIKEVDHLCRNRRCVNPDHLEVVSHKENMKRSSVLRTTCRRGHVFDSHNTRFQIGPNSQVWRSCKTCRNLAKMAQYHVRQQHGQ